MSTNKFPWQKTADEDDDDDNGLLPLYVQQTVRHYAYGKVYEVTINVPTGLALNLTNRYHQTTN